jgi:hypothetical protein
MCAGAGSLSMNRQARRGALFRHGVWASVAGLVLCATPLRAAGAPSFPPAQDIVDRVLSTAHHVGLASADLMISIRFGQPVAAPPACEFRGVLRMSREQLALTVEQGTARPVCWLIERYVLVRLFGERDRVDSLVPLFRFEVIGQKLVDDRPYYLVYARAEQRATDPSWVMGWVDFDRGLVADATLHYSWGEITSAQEYAPMGGVWVLMHQHLDLPRFGASVDIAYSGFRFGPGSRVVSEGSGP